MELNLDTVKVLESQAWPFQSNLMIGCTAEALTTEIKVDKAELDDARWFMKRDVAEALRQSAVRFRGYSRGPPSPEYLSQTQQPDQDLPRVPLKAPPSITISHWLMAAWATGKSIQRF